MIRTRWIESLVSRLMRWWMVSPDLQTEGDDSRQAIVDVLFAAAAAGRRVSPDRMRSLPVQLLRLPFLWDESPQDVQRRLQRARWNLLDGVPLDQRAHALAGLDQREAVFDMVAALITRDRVDAESQAVLDACGRLMDIPRERMREALRAARFDQAPEL